MSTECVQDISCSMPCQVMAFHAMPCSKSFMKCRFLKQPMPCHAMLCNLREMQISGATDARASCVPSVLTAHGQFKLADKAPEHPPPGRFTREIRLGERLSEDTANIKACVWAEGHGLQVVLPKQRNVTEEREVRMLLPSGTLR